MNQHNDLHIPLLTEMLAPAPNPLSLSTASMNAAPESAINWQQLTQDIHEQVLQQLLQQVDALLQQQIAEQMTLACERISAQLSRHIKHNLEQALQQSVMLALEQEIAKNRFLKTQ